MTDSIETLWRKNMDQTADTLTVRVNGLYERKSNDIVGKLNRMYDINFKAIMIACPIVLAGAWMIGVPWLGAWIVLLLIPVIMGARKSLEGFGKLDRTMDSYHYLRAFRDWRDEMMVRFDTIYRIFYPLLFLGMVTQGIYSETGQDVIAELFEGKGLVAGAPLLLWVLIAIATFIIFFSSRAIYRWDINIVYGKDFARLDETLAEMEVLQKGEVS